jgi:hypothetical protein
LGKEKSRSFWSDCVTRRDLLLYLSQPKSCISPCLLRPPTLRTGDQEPGKLDLYTVAKSSNELQKLTDGTQSVFAPNFSYDGTVILYLDRSAPIAADYYIHVADLKGNCHRLAPPVPRVSGINLSAQENVIALYTQYGLLVTDTETALGEDFWAVGSPCN